eukprot:6680494-Lingulodinium_polyedra.AAC.1
MWCGKSQSSGRSPVQPVIEHLRHGPAAAAGAQLPGACRVGTYRALLRASRPGQVRASGP